MIVSSFASPFFFPLLQRWLVEILFGCAYMEVNVYNNIYTYLSVYVCGCVTCYITQHVDAKNVNCC